MLRSKEQVVETLHDLQRMAKWEGFAGPVVRVHMPMSLVAEILHHLEGDGEGTDADAGR